MNAQEIADKILNGCLGGCNDPFLYADQLIEDGDITQEDFQSQESEIWSLVDDQMFTCDVCGWNCWMSELSYEASDMGNSVCDNCYGESND